MRALMEVSIAVEAGNRALEDGMLQHISSDLPLAGERCFFNNLGASVEVTPVMNFEDLRAAFDRLKLRQARRCCGTTRSARLP